MNYYFKLQKTVSLLRGGLTIGNGCMQHDRQQCDSPAAVNAAALLPVVLHDTMIHNDSEIIEFMHACSCLTPCRALSSLYAAATSLNFWPSCSFCSASIALECFSHSMCLTFIQVKRVSPHYPTAHAHHDNMSM